MGTKRRKRSLGEWPNSQMALNANQQLVNQQQPMLSSQMQQQTAQQMVAQQQQSMTAQQQQQHVTHMTPQQQQQFYLQHEQQRQLQQMQQQLHQQQMQQQQQHNQQQSGAMRMQQQQQSAMSFQQQGMTSGAGFHQQNNGAIAFQQSQQLQMQQAAMQNSTAVQQQTPAQQQQSAQQMQQMPVHQQNLMAHQMSQQQQMAQQQQLPLHSSGVVGAQQNASSPTQDQMLTNQQQMQQVQQHLRQQHQLMQQQHQQQQQQQQHHHQQQQQQMLQNEMQQLAAASVQQTNNATVGVAVQQDGNTNIQQSIQQQQVQHRLQQNNTQQCYQQQQIQQRQQQVMNANAMNSANVLANEIQQQNHHQQLGLDKETTPAPIRTTTQPPWKQNQQQRTLSNNNERVPPIQQHIQYQQQPQQQQAAGWTAEAAATTDAHRKKHAPSRKNKKPRTAAAPCPNVDVRDIQTQQQTAYRGPSFMDDPSGYLAQQTALLNNTMHRQQQLEMTACSGGGVESPVPQDANNMLSQFGRPALKSSPHQQQNQSQNQQNQLHNQLSTASAMHSAALNAQILQNCRSCSSSEEENGSGSNTEDGTYHVHTLPKNMDFMEGITVKEEDPVTSSTFSSATMDSVASPDCNSKGPIQGGTVSTSHKSPPELMPSPSPTPSLSSRGSDTPSSDRSPNPNITGEMGTGGYTVTSCYAPTPPPQSKPATPTATLKLHPVMAAGNTVARNTITSVLAGRAQTATTSVSGNSSPAQNQMQQLSFQNGNTRLVHGGNISLGNIQIQSANGQTGAVNGNGNVQVIGSASQFANGGIQMTRLPSGNVQFVQNIPVQNNQTGVQQAGIVQNSLGSINLQNQTMINGNGGHIIQQQLTTQQNQQQQNNGNGNNQQQNIIQNIQANSQQGHQILQSSKVQHNYNPGHILVSSGGQILMSGNFQGTNLMPPPAPKSIIVGNNGMIQSSTANVQLMSSNGNLVGNTVIANNTPNNVLVASNNGSGNNLLVTNQGGMNNHQNSIINNGGMIIGSNQNIVSNQGILNNGQTLNAQLQGANSTIQNSNVVQGMVSGNGGNVVIGGSNLLQNNQNIVTNNAGVIQNNGGMLGQQTVLVNAMPAPFVLQQGFTTVDGTHIVGNVIHQQSVVDQDAVRNANNNQFTARSAILSPESKRKSKKRKPGGQIQQQQQPQQQQQAMVQIQQNVPSQFTPQGFQLSPGLGGLTLVSNKTTPSQILVNNQGATQGSFQTPHINLLQPLNILGPTVQQLIMPQLVMTQDAGILQDATSMPLQLQIQNVNGQNMITPCQSILTTGPGGGVILRAPNPQTKNFISPGGGQFIVQNGQVSPLVTNVSPGQNVNLYGGSVGLVVPTQSGNGQQQNNTQTFVQQNTTIVQQQTTMMSNNNSSTTNCDQNGSAASGASNNSSQYLLQSVNNSQVIESGNAMNNQQQHGQQRQHGQQFIIPVSNAAETTSTVRHKYNVMQTVNTNHHIEQNTMTNTNNSQQQNTQFVMQQHQQQQQNTLTIDNNGTQYVVQQAQPHVNNHQQNQHQQLQIQQQNQQHAQQMQHQNQQQQQQQQQQQNQQHVQIQQHNQQQIQQLQQQHHNQQNEHQQFMFHTIKNQQQLSNDSLMNSNSVSTQTAGQQQQQQLQQQQQQQLQQQQQQQQQQAQVASLPPPDTTTHSPRSPDRAPSPQSFNMSDRHAMAMVHCISSSEPDSVVSPSADGGNSPPEDFCERAQRGGVYIHNNKPVHYQTELKMRHSPLNQCHQMQFSNNMANQVHHQKLEPAAENAADNNIKNESSAMILRIGDLVWGSARGFPAWPGKIIEPPADVTGCTQDDGTVALNDGYRQSDEIQNESVWVRWFGGRSRTVEQVSRSSLQSLSEGLDAHHSARRTARKSRKLNSQLENAIQEAMAELDRISNSGGVQGANNKQCQRMLNAAANAKTSSRSPKSAGPSRQVSKTPVKIAPHPGKVTMNNNVSNNPMTNSSGLMPVNNANTKLVKSDDSVTARLRSANNQR